MLVTADLVKQKQPLLNPEKKTVLFNDNCKKKHWIFMNRILSLSYCHHLWLISNLRQSLAASQYKIQMVSWSKWGQTSSGSIPMSWNGWQPGSVYFPISLHHSKCSLSNITIVLQKWFCFSLYMQFRFVMYYWRRRECILFI